MTIKEAMKERHMVRKYVDKKIPEDLVSKLNERIEENNKKYDLSIKLMLDNDKAVNSIIKLLLAKGVKNYIILAGNDTDDLAEKLGYSDRTIERQKATQELVRESIKGVPDLTVLDEIEQVKARQQRAISNQRESQENTQNI